MDSVVFDRLAKDRVTSQSTASITTIDLEVRRKSFKNYCVWVFRCLALERKMDRLSYTEGDSSPCHLTSEGG